MKHILLIAMLSLGCATPPGVARLSSTSFEDALKEDALLIDPRARAEGGLEGAEHIPLSSDLFDEKLMAAANKHKGKDTTLLFFCNRGRISLAAAERARGLGFTDVRILKGGLHEWRKTHPLAASRPHASSRPRHEASTRPHDDKKGHRGHHAGRHHPFPADKFVPMFEAEGRAAWQKPDELVSSLALKPDAFVADIGAGSGYFARRFAKAAPQGKTFAVDIENSMLAYIKERAVKEGITNLITVKAAMDDPKIPTAVDVIFICDTWHHLGEGPARAAYAQKLKGYLKTGGRVVVVDWSPAGATDKGPPVGMRLTKEVVKSEMAGFKVIEERALPEQYLLVFAAK